MAQVKELLDQRHRPAGYNTGIYCGQVAGQSVPHLHIHVIPRYPVTTPIRVAGCRGCSRALRLTNYSGPAATTTRCSRTCSKRSTTPASSVATDGCRRWSAASNLSASALQGGIERNHRADPSQVLKALERLFRDLR